jgi:outer membrane protein TolC
MWVPSASAATNLAIYSVGFDASWEIDQFGGLRRGIENAKETFQAQAATFSIAKCSSPAK